MKSLGRYTVRSQGFYLRHLAKALRGAGTDGGAYTADPREARRYHRRRDAQVAADQIHGVVVVMDDLNGMTGGRS